MHIPSSARAKISHSHISNHQKYLESWREKGRGKKHCDWLTLSMNSDLLNSYARHSIVIEKINCMKHRVIFQYNSKPTTWIRTYTWIQTSALKHFNLDSLFNRKSCALSLNLFLHQFFTQIWGVWILFPLQLRIISLYVLWAFKKVLLVPFYQI